MEHENWRKTNKRARIFILAPMTNALAIEYEGEQIARNIMSNREKDTGDVSLIKVLSLVNHFLSTKVNEGASINEHVN